MDEFREEYEEDIIEEEELEDLGDEELVDELNEAQRAEVADISKFLRQHPEIWIPYEDQVLEQLNPREPGSNDSDTGIHISLRDLKQLDAKHCTYPFLTNYERTKCTSYRASQISNGAKPYILVPEGVTDSYEIAKMELEAKRLPFILKRPLPDGSFEVWRLSDLIIF